MVKPLAVATSRPEIDLLDRRQRVGCCIHPENETGTSPIKVYFPSFSFVMEG